MSWRRCMSPRQIVSSWMLLFGYSCIGRLRLGSSSVNAEFPDIIKVSVLTDGEANLPCDTYLPQPSDVLLIVAWYKDDVPMYSYDGRVNGPASHWSDNTLTGRVYWHNAEPSTLVIRNVEPTDRALYRCRVDFKISPTSNQNILLDVIELPENMKIIDEFDQEVIESAGPYIEDISMKLTCVVSGGNPTPRLRWWRNDKIVVGPVSDSSNSSELELKIAKLTRDYYEAVYYCTADNTALVPPLRVNVQIQLYLRPLFVEIVAREEPLSVNRKTDIACRTAGARPPAVITWWLNNVRLNSSEQKTSDNQNETVSVLRWRPQMENNGKELVCRASHTVLKYSTIQSNFTLNLQYVPIVVLKMGSSLNPADIKVGDDVYFECVVRANPPAYKITWEYNGQPMTHNRVGVIKGSAHLVLQNVSRDQTGMYSCTASNVEGDSMSKPIPLQVVYKPVCKMTAMAFVSATINKKVEISCEVDANPQPERFQWRLYSSLRSVKLISGNFTSVNGSVLTFTPKSKTEFGTVSCKATNMVGQQVEPCLYKLIVSTRPDCPNNCSTYNITDDAVELRCMPGYDGGLRALHIVEAWKYDELILNVSRPSPTWKLRGLGSGKTLKLVVYSHNEKGRSEYSTLRVHTLSQLSLHTEADANWLLGVLLGLAGAIIVVLVITRLARRRFQQAAQYEGSHTKELNTFPKSPPHFGTPPLRLSKSSNSVHEIRLNTYASNKSAYDAQSHGKLTQDWRGVTSGTLTLNEIVTTRTPFLANVQESFV